MGGPVNRMGGLRTSSFAADSTLETDDSHESTLAFLGDVLMGDTDWSVDEVTKLLALHTLVAVERRRVVLGDTRTA
jgi:hypothetical protein